MINDNHLAKLELKLDKLCLAIESMKEQQERVAEDISKIKEAVYNPDEGLYARLRALESWKGTSSKMIWILFTSVVGLICAFILKSVSI